MTGVDVEAEQLALLSHSARRLLRRPRPRFRGTLHRWAAMATVPLGVVFVVVADGGRARVATAVFMVGTLAMFAVSALVHHRDWGVHEVETLIRLDHSAIFLMFAATTTPVAMLGLDAPVSTWMLWIMWVGATVGMVVEWLPVHPPRGVMNAGYFALGWSMVVFVPWMIQALTGWQLALLFAGGAAYTLGGVIVGAQRPDPWPTVFGYHEIWHVFVVVAAALHGALVLDLAAP